MLASPALRSRQHGFSHSVLADVINRAFLRDEWLALFAVLVGSQLGHFAEHTAQMAQIHLLGLTGANARGIVGMLDVEVVHFTWNTAIIAATVLLVRHFPTNRWLWLAAVLAGWHEVEHAYIFSVYLTTGVSGTPGLLASGGLLAGGLPLSRADLHFLYNLAETTPLCLAFVWQRRSALIRSSSVAGLV
jgi:hypothetical protein